MKNIKIEYDGKYPNLCSGKLIVYIDEVKYDFDDNCLNSGGIRSFTEYWDYNVKQGEWSVEFPKDFPDELKDAVLEEINSKIPHGCCGGCVN